ncbi:MAG: putative lipid II flippase FtsW [Limnochordaceae bacterium]|nr:putative lipid II flippase FtsW [Limnochordaceae bacterium]
MVHPPAAVPAGAARRTPPPYGVAPGGWRAQRSPGLRTDIPLLAASVLLLGLGLVMVFSASYVQALAESGDPLFYVKRQLQGAVLGSLALILFARVDYHYWRRFTWPLVGLATVLLVTVLFVGREIAGAKRWIPLGPINLQSSEVAKIALVLALADWGVRRRFWLRSFWKGYLPPLLLGVVFFGLIMLEPDLGTGLTIVGTTVLVLFVAGVSGWQLLGTALAGLPAVAYLIWSEPYRWRRIVGFLNPWADPAGAGYQTIQSLLAVGSGGLFGVGLGASRQKFYYLPEQHTDFIFGIIGEELGFLGAVFVVLLFLVLGWRGLRAALRAPDLYGTLLATGLAGLIVIQAFLNIGVVTGVLPVTGVTLPFISYGSSSLVVSLASVGILLNIAGQGRIG